MERTKSAPNRLATGIASATQMRITSISPSSSVVIVRAPRCSAEASGYTSTCAKEMDRLRRLCLNTLHRAAHRPNNSSGAMPSWRLARRIHQVIHLPEELDQKAEALPGHHRLLRDGVEQQGQELQGAVAHVRVRIRHRLCDLTGLPSVQWVRLRLRIRIREQQAEDALLQIGGVLREALRACRRDGAQARQHRDVVSEDAILKHDGPSDVIFDDDEVLVDLLVVARALQPPHGGLVDADVLGEVLQQERHVVAAKAREGAPDKHGQPRDRSPEGFPHFQVAHV
eukprot:scaffold273_cov242-Pinguiococcus_pyrenoidosus.AAC.36